MTAPLDSPPPFFLPNPLHDEDMGTLVNMSSAGVFNPDQVDFALAAQCSTPSLQVVAGMQPRACGELDMVLDNNFGEASRALASANVWSGDAVEKGIATGGNAGHRGSRRDTGSVTLKLEDVEASHLPSALPTTSASVPTAKPPQTRGKRATNTTATTGPAQPAQLAQTGQPAQSAQPAQPGQQGQPGQRRKRPSRNRAYTSPEDAEKRKRFLERNRMAAYKCRKRRKEELVELQNLHANLQRSREEMEEELRTVRASLSDLASLAMSHHGCQDQRLAEWLQEYQASERARALRRQQQESQDTNCSQNFQAANEEDQSGLPMYMSTGCEAANNNPGIHGSNSGLQMQQHQQHQQHQQQQQHQQLHQPQLQQHQQIGAHEHHGLLSMPAVSAQPESVPSALLIPVQPTIYSQAPFTVPVAASAGPVPGALFSALSPQGCVQPSPPALESSHIRTESTYSFSSTDSSYAPSYPLKAASRTSSVSSFHETPHMADFPGFADAKPFPPNGNEEEVHDSMFANFFVPESPAPVI